MSDIKFKPLGMKILVKQDSAETTTKSGIVLTESGTEKPKKGTVIAVGSGIFDPMSKQQIVPGIIIGQKVYWNYAGPELELEGEKYIVLEESSLLGTE